MGAQQEEEGGVAKRRKVVAAATDVTMDLDILDCPVCFHPLRPPVFQKSQTQRAISSICSPCHDKLPDKCSFCSLPTVYNRRKKTMRKVANTRHVSAPKPAAVSVDQPRSSWSIFQASTSGSL